MKPNKLTALKSQLAEVWGEIENKIPTEIKKEEAHLYHCVLVRATRKAGSLKLDYAVNIVKYNDRSWEAVKGNLARAGYDQIQILHDPTIKEDEKEEPKKESKKQPKNEEPKTEAEDDEEGEEVLTAKEYRQNLKEEAKALGYEGAMNVKNEILEEFIENAKENGEG